MKYTRTASVIGVVAASALLFAGCSSQSSSPSAAPAKSDLKITVSTTQLGDFTKQVVGDTGAEVTQIVAPNQSPHDLELTAANSAALADSGAVIVNGFGLDQVVSDAAPADKIIDTSTGVTPIPATEDEKEESEEGHSHTELVNDPHIWTDPANAKIQVQNIADGLAKADPEHADDYKSNASAYEAKLDDVDKWIKDTFAPVQPDARKFVSTHDAFAYFVKAFDITQDDSVLNSLDDHAEPSEAELQSLVTKIKGTGVKAVFAEASVDPKIVQRIADESGVKLYSGDDALYGDSLGEAGSEGETYLKATVHNVTLIGQSWGLDPKTPEGL